ncbi:MAG: cell wall-binding repeat-containing protein [Buchananella hordeovulneris]|nr:cell wall-binding repeat-containing protein [Buchananella hordeovulneris]
MIPVASRLTAWRAALTLLVAAALVCSAPWAASAHGTPAAPPGEVVQGPSAGNIAWASADTTMPPAAGREEDEDGDAVPIREEVQAPARSGLTEPQYLRTRIERLHGADRYQTANRIYFAGNWSDDGLVIASGENFADALAATPFAAARNMPIVLVAKGRIPPATDQVLRAAYERGVRTVYLVGGTSVMTAPLRAQIRSYGFAIAQHFGGADRNVTAEGLAYATTEIYQQQDTKLETIFLVDGTNFADALAAGPAAAERRGVILLTSGTTVPPATWHALSKLRAERHVIGGAPAAALKHDADVIVAGADRYETAVQVARVYLPDANSVYLASGQSFPDALAGGALAAGRSATLLLTPPNRLPGVVESYLPPRKFTDLTVLGGTSSVTATLFNHLLNTVGAP